MLFKFLFRQFAFRWLFPRHIESIKVTGDLPAGDRPVLFIANHSSWWDGLLIYYIHEKFLGTTPNVLMDQAQLAKRPLFTQLGAFGIDKSSPRRSLAGLQRAAELVQAGQSVWIFPQGDMYHLESRPLHIHSGFAHVLHLAPEAVVVPVSFYYSSVVSPKVSVRVAFGSPIEKDWSELSRKQLADELGAVLTSQLDDLRAATIQHVDTHRGNEA